MAGSQVSYRTAHGSSPYAFSQANIHSSHCGLLQCVLRAGLFPCTTFCVHSSWMFVFIKYYMFSICIQEAAWALWGNSVFCVHALGIKYQIWLFFFSMLCIIQNAAKDHPW